MSGAITATTIATIATAAVGAGSLAYGIVQGQSQQNAQDKSLKAQNTAQGEAKAQALSTQRKAELAQNAVNQKTPDIAAILGRAAQPAKGGVGSTMLTGPGGVTPSSLNLGSSTLLGS